MQIGPLQRGLLGHCLFVATVRFEGTQSSLKERKKGFGLDKKVDGPCPGTSALQGDCEGNACLGCTALDFYTSYIWKVG